MNKTENREVLRDFWNSQYKSMFRQGGYAIEKVKNWFLKNVIKHIQDE